MSEQELREEIHRMRDEIVQELRSQRAELRAELSEIKAKQSTRDAVCAAERQRNEQTARQVQAQWNKLDEAQECRRCASEARIAKSEARIAKLEWHQAIQSRIAWLLTATTIGLVAKQVWDAFWALPG